MTYTQTCAEGDFSATREFESDLILPMSAHQIETGHAVNEPVNDDPEEE